MKTNQLICVLIVIFGGSCELSAQSKQPLVICDQATTGGLFGHAEATFFQLNRADGVRFDDDAGENADSEFEFTPRYTIGYENGKGAGVRARFWGNFDQSAPPKNPGPLTQANRANRLVSDASSLDLEVFNTLCLAPGELEFFAGLKYADYFEAIYDTGRPQAETAKQLDGWGPTIGAEFRKPVNKNSRFYAKARQSIITGDARLGRVGEGTRTLNNSTAGVFEMGLGIEHSRKIGNTAVTLTGGYEWQKWSNFSYGFEDTHFTDDISTPADAGFNGFTLGVGITRAGSSINYADCLHASEPGSGLFGEFEATFFKYNRADGLRLDTVPLSVANDTGIQFTPRYTIGYEFSPGSGIRFRRWAQFEQSARINFPPIRALGVHLYSEAETTDIEWFDTLSTPEYDIELSAGLRQAKYFEAMNDFFPFSPDSSKEVDGWGPVFGAEIKRKLSPDSLFYVKGRQALITANAVAGGRDFLFTGPDVITVTQDDAMFGITEIGFGLEQQKYIGNSKVTFCGGYEWQQWQNFSYGFQDALFSDAMNAPADAGFNGATFSVGITGKGGNDLPEIAIENEAGGNSGLFGTVEATVFKFNRADGVRTDVTQIRSAESDYEFSPRYTVGYRFDSGVGLRFRYWDYGETAFPDDPGIRAQGNRLVSEASMMDIEVFDTVSLCNFDFEWSAGLQQADYFEAIFDNEFTPFAVTETAKRLDGWGPVIGLEMRKPLPGGNLFYAKGRQSLIVGDAINTDIFAGNLELSDTTAGVTEIGLGLEHTRSIGCAILSLRGGYEWQRWRNFSYGFEDSHTSGFIAAPADAGFNGFTFSVGIQK